MNLLKVIVLILFLSPITAGQSAVVIPAGEELYSLVYKNILRNRFSDTTSYNYQLAPYLIESNKNATKNLPFLNYKSINRTNFFLMATEKFYTKKNSRSTAFESIAGGVNINPYENFYLYSSFILDEKKAEDINYEGKKWRGLAGDIKQSFVLFNSDKIDIFFGRYSSNWGVENSLLLSDQVSLDGFGYRIRWKKLTLSYRLAKLDLLNNSLSTNYYDNRYFAAHRFDFRLFNNLRFGLFESVVYGGYGRNIELNYLNPIIFFHTDQLNDNINDNTFVGFDFDYMYKHKVNLYGQIFVDDYQIEKKSQGDEEPNQYGLIIGSKIKNLTNTIDSRLEYIKIKNRTYNQTIHRNRYLYKNRSIGFYDKNDFDLIILELTKWFDQQSLLTFEYSYSRQGEGDIRDSWTEPWLETTEPYNEPFPTGIVEKSHTIKANIKAFVFSYFYLDLTAGFQSVKNLDNIQCNDDDIHFLNLNITTFISAKN